MDEPTSLLPPVSTQSLEELLAGGALPLAQGLELMSAIAGQVARLHERARSHGLLTPDVIRVQTFENGPPQIIFNDIEATRDTTEGADLLALGVLAFKVLSGRGPNPGETLAQVLPSAPVAVDRLVSRLMAPRAQDRLSAAGAQRQFHDLCDLAATPGARTAAPLEAPPQIKRGVPLSMQPTSPHNLKHLRDNEPTQGANPFADDEKTARVNKNPTEPPVDGPAMEDEPTQFEPVRRPAKKPAPERTPLPPPVATPVSSPLVEEPTREQFEPSRSDLPGEEPAQMADPRVLPRRKRKAETPLEQLIGTLQRQPPWVWAVLGVGVSFLLLLLLALAR